MPLKTYHIMTSSDKNSKTYVSIKASSLQDAFIRYQNQPYSFPEWKIQRAYKFGSKHETSNSRLFYF